MKDTDFQARTISRMKKRPHGFNQSINEWMNAIPGGGRLDVVVVVVVDDRAVRRVRVVTPDSGGGGVTSGWVGGQSKYNVSQRGREAPRHQQAGAHTNVGSYRVQRRAYLEYSSPSKRDGRCGSYGVRRSAWHCIWTDGGMNGWTDPGSINHFNQSIKHSMMDAS